MTPEKRHLINVSHVAAHHLLTAANLHGNRAWEKIARELCDAAMDCEPYVYTARKHAADDDALSPTPNEFGAKLAATEIFTAEELAVDVTDLMESAYGGMGSVRECAS